MAQTAATVTLDDVNVANARQQYERQRSLWAASGGRGVSRQDLDNAKAALDVQTAHKQADGAQLALLRQELSDAVLIAPMDATVRSRIMEPGEMVSPQKPVFSLAITNPKWVRVYVGETDLGKLQPGMHASVSVDSFPGRSFSGWVGFISSVAEFTPKTIETADLRTSLVYEVRVFVNDPANAIAARRTCDGSYSICSGRDRQARGAAWSRIEFTAMTVDDAAVLIGRDVRRTFRRSKNETVVALDKVSLTVDRGTLTALVGPDGAGKTTLIRLTAGLMAPDLVNLACLGSTPFASRKKFRIVSAICPNALASTRTLAFGRTSIFMPICMASRTKTGQHGFQN